jgi:DNA-binding transcriptional LysR family regulator
MELRHLRYFIAVAEEGSLLHAAERRLHTAQPSLSRQIRDLELELGVKLLERKARGIELTAAGRVFLDHARLALMQVELACEAARNTERPHKPGFRLGFLPGQEVIWLSEALRILREEASDVDVTITTKSSPELANALMQGEIDVALLRREVRTPGLDFRFLVKEPLIAILPSHHPLASAQDNTAGGHLSRGLHQHSTCRSRAKDRDRGVRSESWYQTEADLRCRDSIRRNVTRSIHGRLHAVADLCAKYPDSCGGRSAFAR